MTETDKNSPKPVVLVVDDEPSIRKVFSLVLQDICRVITTSDALEALAKLKENKIDVALLDIRLPGMDGLELLRKIKEYNNEIQAIMVTGVKELDVAVQSMKLGAYNYITKPFDVDELRMLVLEVLNLKKDLFTLQEYSFFPGEYFLKGESAKFKKLLEELEKQAAGNGNVLITGEPGTEKEEVALDLFQRGSRKSGPPVEVSFYLNKDEFSRKNFMSQICSRIKVASGGLVIIKGIHCLPLELQPELFAFLTDEPRPDVRILTLADVNLKLLVEQGLFREDLFYILSLAVISVPTLRERAEDIPLLLEAYLKKYNSLYGKKINNLAPDVIRIMTAYLWPGNMLELVCFIENLVLGSRSEDLSLSQLPVNLLDYFSAGDLNENLEVFRTGLKNKFQKFFVEKALAGMPVDTGRVASRLGLTESELMQINNGGN